MKTDEDTGMLPHAESMHEFYVRRIPAQKAWEAGIDIDGWSPESLVFVLFCSCGSQAFWASSTMPGILRYCSNERITLNTVH